MTVKRRLTGVTSRSSLAALERKMRRFGRIPNYVLKHKKEDIVEEEPPSSVIEEQAVINSTAHNPPAPKTENRKNLCWSFFAEPCNPFFDSHDIGIFQSEPLCEYVSPDCRNQVVCEYCERIALLHDVKVAFEKTRDRE